MDPGRVIVFATPVFLLLIAAEFAWGLYRARRGGGRNSYALGDTVNSLGLGVLSQLTGIFSSAWRIALYTLVYAAVGWQGGAAFWSSPWGWLLALLFYDFCYYWLHRMGHECALLWAAHVVHHQSQHYNLSTALRQTSTGFVFDWLFYLPMALAGVPPLVFAVVAMIDLLYQFWVHTEQIGKLGWFDRWFCAPSNHRVHHAVNDEYLDRNYGGILLLWDRLFGSYTPERAPCVYGTRSPLQSWDPLWANAEVYRALWQQSRAAPCWREKLRIWLGPPGWQPPQSGAASSKPLFDLVAARQRFDPVVARGVRWVAGLQFVLLLALTLLFLWHASALPAAQGAVMLAALGTGLWAVGALLQGRIDMGTALVINFSIAATAGAALGWFTVYAVCKPLATLALWMCAVWQGPLAATRRGARVLLGCALAASLLGDVFLIWPERFFVLGLASFLVAHLFYLALLRSVGPWFAHRAALGVCLLAAVAMVGVLWAAGLPSELRLPVSVYALVLALMAAQAWGRAFFLGKAVPAQRVAWGALLFMASDTLLAINQFATPLPLTSLWVLALYYAAQLLIACNVLRSPEAPRPAS